MLLPADELKQQTCNIRELILSNKFRNWSQISETNHQKQLGEHKNDNITVYEI